MNEQYRFAQKKAFSIFQKVAVSCEAYSSFFKERNFNYKKVTASQFRQIPISDKDTYLRKYPLEKRIYKDTELANFYMLSMSSGSTGKPTIWPRGLKKDAQLEALQTIFLDQHFGIKRKKTLIVVSFGMGVTTAGMLTSKLAWEGTKHGKMSVITPGVDSETTVFLIQRLYRHYKQVVCIGYPPFISEFVDLATKKRYSVKKWNLKICYAGESVSAKWRNQMARKISSKGDASNIVAFYGSSETGIIGVETRETNKVIEHCLADEVLRAALFNDRRLPTLVEVDMMKNFVEIIGGEVVITADQPVPLIRYNLHDHGVFVTANHIKSIFVQKGISYRLGKPDRVFLAVFGKKEAGSGETVFFIEDLRYVLGRVSSKSKLTGFFQYKEEILQRKTVLQLRVYLKNGLKLTKREKVTFKKEAVKLLKKVRVDQKRVFSSPLELKVLFSYQDSKRKYKKGKLQYNL